MIIIPKRNELIDVKIMICCYALIGINTAIVNCSILGFMNLLDSSYQQITLSGQAFAGVIASILRIITRYIYPSDINGLENSTQVFFYVGAFYCIISAIIFMMVGFNQYIQYKKNIFAMSIAGYFTSIKQEINDRSSINSCTDYTNDDDKIEISQSRSKSKSKSRSKRGSKIKTEPLQLFESQSFMNSANPYRTTTATSEQYQKMSTSTTKIASRTKTRNSTQDTRNQQNKIDNNSEEGKQQSKMVKLKPSEYQRLKKQERPKHLTLTHLASLQNQKQHSYSLWENYQSKIYVTDAVYDLLNSSLKTKRNKKRNKGDISDANTGSANASSNISEKSLFSKIGLFNMAYRLFPKIQHFCFAILLLNILTWSIFPGLISGKIKSELSFISENHWLSIFLSAEFFICNFIGRLILSSPKFCNYILCCCRYESFFIYLSQSIMNLFSV